MPGVVKIVSDVVWSRVVNSDENVDGILYSFLSAKIKGAEYSDLYKSGVWDGMRRFYDKVSKRFLTGFLDMVVKRLKMEGYEVDVVFRNDWNKLNEIDKNIQIELLKQLNGLDFERFIKVQYPLLEEWLKSGRGAVRLATGGGKTEIICAVAKLFYDRKVLVLVHRVELLEQTRKRLSERLGERIGVVWSEGVDIGCRVVVGMVQTLISRMPQLSEWFRGIDVLIIDECHHMGAKTWISLAIRCPARYRLGLSGTPLVENEERDMWLIGLTGHVIEGIGVKELSEIGYGVLPCVNVVIDGRLKFSKFYKSYWDAVRDVFTSVRFLEVIGDTVLAHIAEKGERGIIIFTERINVMFSIYRFLKEVCKLNVMYSFGGMSDEMRLRIFNQFKDGRIPVLVTTTILDEGIDVSGIRAIVFACSNVSIVKILQRIGRGVRVEEGKDRVFVYDFAIDGKYFKGHLKKRLALYRKEGFEIELKRIEGGRLVKI